MSKPTSPTPISRGVRGSSLAESQTLVERRLRALVKREQARLGLGHWDIQVRFGPFADEHGQTGTLTAACEHYPDYLEAMLYFDTERIIDQGEDLRILVRHELLHCHTSALVGLAETWAGEDVQALARVESENERLVSLLSRLV